MKPENRYIKRVHNAVKRQAPEVYCQKFQVSFSNGIFDCWYSGFLEDLWIEYKWLPKMTRQVLAKKLMSELQFQWGTARAKEGRNVAVCIGSPEGGILLWRPGLWSKPQPTTSLLSASEVAQEIVTWVGRRHDVG